MPIFRTVINAHLDLTRKLPELPDVVVQEWVDEVEYASELAGLMMARLSDIPKHGGINATIKLESGKTKKVFVWAHMIVYISTDIAAVSPSFPAEDPDKPGEFLGNNGERIQKQ